MFEIFLDKEEQKKYTFIKKLEESDSFTLSINEMMDELQISNYVFKRLTQSLLIDFQRFHLENLCEVAIIEQNIVLNCH